MESPPGPRQVREVPAGGRTARLAASITCSGLGARARLELDGGLNDGTVLRTDPDGGLAGEALYPGFTIVTVRVDGVGSCTREIWLRHGRSNELRLDFGEHGWVAGRVVDEAGEPVARAAVSLDGAPAGITDADGRFGAAQLVSGAPLLLVEAQGHARHRESLRGFDPAAGGEHEVVLRRACRLELTLDPGQAGGVAQVYLVPHAGGPRTAGGTQPAYPWYLVEPFELAPGETRVLADLPTCRLDVLAFAPLAKGSAVVRWLTPDRPGRIRVPLHPVPRLSGRLVRRGQPVRTASVTLDADNRARAVVQALGEHGSAPKWLPIGHLPSSHQVSVVDSGGGFVFGLHDTAPHPRYLTVTEAGGAPRVFELPARAGDLTIDLGP